MSGVPELLSVVRSIVGLLGEVVLVSIVLVLSMVVSGMSFVSVAVGAGVGRIGSGSWSWRGSGLSCALRWLDGTVLAVLCVVACWVVRRQAQSSLMVQHWNADEVGMWIVQCW